MDNTKGSKSEGDASLQADESMGPVSLEGGEELENDSSEPSSGFETFLEPIGEPRFDTGTDEGRRESIAETLEYLGFDGDWGHVLARIPPAASDPDETELDRFHAAVQLIVIFEHGSGPFSCAEISHAAGEFQRFGLHAPKTDRRHERCLERATMDSSAQRKSGQ